MPGTLQIQDMLERMLGTYPMPFHDYFWRGKTRDELVATEMFGVPILVPGQPDKSNLLQAMRGAAPSENGEKPFGVGRLRQIFSKVDVSAKDVDLLDAWIREGCPEIEPKTGLAFSAAAAPGTTAGASDQTHVNYWKAIDQFFLLASPTTRPHVNNVRGLDSTWIPALVQSNNIALWLAKTAEPKIANGFDYIRHHQRRLILEFYSYSKEALLDSLWKFGGNLLPLDPASPSGIPNHTMNGIGDWFNWSPYLDMSLRAADIQPVDIDLARGWQIGIVADGLMRTDEDRPEGQRMPIPDFNAGDPDLKSKVFAKYADADPSILLSEMIRRARDVFGGSPVA